MPDEWKYDGHDAESLRALLDLPAVVLRERVSSTLDIAHALGASGTPAGTLILADEQTAGRGRGGRSWASEKGAGIWLTLMERPVDAESIEVLSIRVGLRAAPVLERHTAAPVSLKWPNDLYVGEGKLAGILVEARWREERPEWVAIGVGINARLPNEFAGASSLVPETDRVEVLAELVPAIRSAAAARGTLTDAELARYAARDLAYGRRCTAPAVGTVKGIDERGCLIVQTASGEVAVRSGSLVLH